MKGEQIAFLLGKISGGLIGLADLAKDHSCAQVIEDKINSLLDMVNQEVSEIYYSECCYVDRALPESVQKTIDEFIKAEL